MGLPLAWLALTPSEAVAYLALVVVGIRNAIEDVGLFTLAFLVPEGTCPLRGHWLLR
jgi:hypothetical protein